MRNSNNIFDFSLLSRDAIAQLLQKYQLNLSVDEALTIQNVFLQRPPTLAECVLWSIQGSEHCSYKSSRTHLKQFNTSGPHVILGAKEDAGIVSVAQDNQGFRYGVIVSHESHNHPSQIVPYEGAATGVGGNVRDVCCMGGEVIAVADSLRFGDIKRAHTHWIHDGVVSGIGGYGNPLGIPNIAGDVYYDKGYNDNCLVTVVTLGIVREDDIIHSYAPEGAKDYVYILVGKPTDNSGFNGASFASSTLEQDSKEKNKGAVQEPNAFLQRHILKANYALFSKLKDMNLIQQVGFKDLGAGGIACASIELAEAGGSFGANICLEQVPIAMADLLPEVILCSETQERFMWVVPRHLTDFILDHYNQIFALPNVSKGACAAVIGTLRDDGLYVVTFHGSELVRAKVPDITKGIIYARPFSPKVQKNCEPKLPHISDYDDILLKLLAHENIASRSCVYETYDKQVQGRTHIEAGWADAGVMQPFNEEKYPEEIRKTGIALSLDHNPRYNQIDAYWGAINAVIESVRNIAAVGANPVSLSDCLCFGNPEKPECMGEFTDSVQGIIDACAAIKLKNYPAATLPVIAGNVSLYNESQEQAIPPSPMISCLGVLPNIEYSITFDLKKEDSLLVLIGERKDECGGSVLYQLFETLGLNLPKPDLNTISNEIQGVSEAIQKGLVLAAHDISEGGVAVALAEMSFKNSIGLTVEIPGNFSTETLVFGESGGFILEVSKEHRMALDSILSQYHIPYWIIGSTNQQAVLQINSVINLPVNQAKQAWEQGLRGKLL